MMSELSAISEKALVLTVNKRKYQLFAKSNETLLDLLRKHLQIKSVKAACWSGDCGICTVLLDNIPIKSCLVLAHEVNNRCVTTVEGLIDDKMFIKLQESFIKHGAVQCGFCTGGFLLLGYYLITKGTSLDRETVSDSLNGVICRCTGYKQIIDAILNVVDNFSSHQEEILRW